MEDTPYSEIEFPSSDAILRQFSLYFLENATSLRTERPTVPIKTVTKAYIHIIKDKKACLRLL